MPWQSKRQAKWGHTPAGEKALGGSAAVREWDEATDFKDLPMKSRKVDLGKKGSFHVKEGALHEMLHVPEGEKVGQARMKKAARSSNPLLARRARAGLGLSHMAKG